MRATFSKNSGNKSHLGLKGGGRVWQFFLYNIRGEPFIDWLKTEDNHMYMYIFIQVLTGNINIHIYNITTDEE